MFVCGLVVGMVVGWVLVVVGLSVVVVWLLLLFCFVWFEKWLLWYLFG